MSQVSWRISFVLLTIFFVITLILTLKYLTEPPNTQDISSQHKFLDIKSIIQDKLLIKFSVLAGLIYTYNIFYYATSAFVYRAFFHVSVIANGYIYSMAAISVLLASLLLKKMLNHYKRHQIMHYVIKFYFVANFILFVLFGCFHLQNLFLFVALTSCSMLSFGFLSPLFIAEGLIVTQLSKSTTSSFQVLMRVGIAVIVGGAFTYLPKLDITELTSALFIIALSTYLVQR